MDARRNPEPTELTATARQAEACRYRLQGHSFREIGRMMGISGHAAWELVDTAVRNEHACRNATVQFIREIELDRLDNFLVIATAIVEDKEATRLQRLQAIQTCLEISKCRSKLLGLDDAPRPADHSFITDKDRLVREIRERTATARAKLAAQAMATLREESDDRDPAVPPSFDLPEPMAIGES